MAHFGKAYAGYLLELAVLVEYLAMILRLKDAGVGIDVGCNLLRSVQVVYIQIVLVYFD